MEALVHHDWSKNNIRQLRNTVELARDLAEGDTIDLPILERVLRIQSGESPGLLTPGPAGADELDPGCLVRINSEEFGSLLEKETARSPEDKRERGETPFYRLQSEFQARAITEGLRSCRWKIRPAARLLGISPMKLRTALKDYLEFLLRSRVRDLEQAAGELDIPLEVLQKKAKDFGLEGLETGEEVS